MLESNNRVSLDMPDPEGRSNSLMIAFVTSNLYYPFR